MPATFNHAMPTITPAQAHAWSVVSMSSNPAEALERYAARLRKSANESSDPGYAVEVEKLIEWLRQQLAELQPVGAAG